MRNRLTVLLLGLLVLGACDPAGDLLDPPAEAVVDGEDIVHVPQSRSPQTLGPDDLRRPLHPPITVASPSMQMPPAPNVPRTSDPYDSRPTYGIVPHSDGTGLPRGRIVRGTIQR